MSDGKEKDCEYDAEAQGKRSRSTKKSPGTRKKSNDKSTRLKAATRSTSKSTSANSDESLTIASSESKLPPDTTTQPPDWLKKKPIACNKWHEIYSDLSSRQLIASCDLDLLALYCDAWQEFSNAAEACDHHGTFFETEKGYVAIHPAKLIRDKAAETIQRLADRLGIGVNKRRGLKVINPETDDNGDPIANYAKTKPRG